MKIVLWLPQGKMDDYYNQFLGEDSPFSSSADGINDYYNQLLKGEYTDHLRRVFVDHLMRDYYLETNLDSILPVGTIVYIVDDNTFSKQFKVAEILYEYDMDLLHLIVDIEEDEERDPSKFVQYLKKHWTFSP